MRRMLGAYVAGVLALAGVLVAAPASADPTSVIINAPYYIPIDATAPIVIAHLDESPSDGSPVIYDWDLDNDGAYDDAHADSLLWNPAARAVNGLGTYTLRVRATLGEQTFETSWDIEVIGQFKVMLGNPVAVAGRTSSIGATVYNFPMNSVLTYSWELDGDGDFNDIADPHDDLIEPIWQTPGDYTIQVKVIHDQLADPVPVSASTVVKVIPAVTLTSVGITGTLRAGYLLTSTGATPTPSDADLARVWLRDGTPIAGATGSTYKLTTYDSGRRVSVRVDAAKDDWGDALPVTKTVNVAAACIVRPTFTGTTRVGRRLTGSKGTWRAPSHTFSYRWLRDGRPITGATRTTYTTTRADRGHLITFQVTAKRTGFPTVTAKSVARRIS